jgi:hypothetical protein
VGVRAAGVEAAMQWEYVPQASRAVGVSAGQQNLTEWLKGVMRSDEPGGCDNCLDVQVHRSHEPGGAVLSVTWCIQSSYFVDPVSSIVCQCGRVCQRSNLFEMGCAKLAHFSCVCDSV